MQKTSYGAIALIIISGIIGGMVGYYLTPNYTLDRDAHTSDLGPADRSVDLRYINAMISHHRGAVLLAQQALNTSQKTEIRDLATKILAEEPIAIQELYDWKKLWYKDSRSVPDPIVPELGPYDQKYDLRLLNALIAHHTAGLAMARDISTKSSRLEILNNADAVSTFFITTGEIFKQWRQDWYGL